MLAHLAILPILLQSWLSASLFLLFCRVTVVAAVPASTPRTTASDSPARLHARRFRLPLPHHSPTPPPSHRRHLVRRHGGWTSEGYDPDFRPKAFPISPENKEGVPVPPTFSSLAALDADGGQLQGLTLGEQYMHLYNKFYDECMRDRIGFEAENECHAQAVAKAEVKMQQLARNTPTEQPSEQQRPFNEGEKHDNSLWSSGVKYIRSSPHFHIKSLLSNLVSGGGFLPGGSRGRTVTRMARTAPAVSPFFRRVIIP